MAIAFDAKSNLDGDVGTTHTWPHTCTGANLVLLVGGRDQAGSTVTGATYNGVPMTQISALVLDGTDTDYFFYLLNPATGTNNIVVTFSASSSWYGKGASYTGVSQVGFPDAAQTNTGSAATSLTGTVTTVADNAWTVMFADNDTGAFSAGGGTTIRTTVGNQAMTIADSNGAITPAGSTTLNLTMASSKYTYSMVSMAPVGAGTTNKTYKALMGVGI